MPGKTAAAKKNRSRQRNKKAGSQNESLSWKRNMGAPMPPRYYCTLRSALYGTIDSAQTSGRYFVILNEPGLPWLGGGWPNPSTSISGLSTAGFDQLCNSRFYQNYRCFSSRVKVEILPIADQDTIEVTVTPSVQSGVPSNVAAAINQPYSHRGIASPRYAASKRGGQAISHAMAVHTMLGVRKSAVEDDLSGRLIGNFTTPPSGLFYYIVNWVHMDATPTTLAMEYRVEISFDVEFSNFSSGDLIFS